MYEIEGLLVRLVLGFFDADAINAFFRNPQNTAVFIGCLIAIAGGCLGCFLLLRGMALSSDAISHTVLLGIVVAFIAMTALGRDPDISSPLLLIGAAASGVITVFLTEALQRTGLLKQDAALGLVFPFLFAIAIILVSRYADDIHLDQDAVMVGEIGIAWADTNSHPIGSYENIDITASDPRAEFSRQCLNCNEENISPRDPRARFVEVCNNCGVYDPVEAYTAGFIHEKPTIVFWPRSLTVMLLLCICTVIFVIVFFKELKLSTFDHSLAHSLGFKPTLLLYILMGFVSMVAVGAFNAVGSILVIAFFIIPPATAYLLSDRLDMMLIISAIVGSLSAFLGYDLARGSLLGINLAGLTGGIWDSSISATMAITMLMLFTITFLLSPRYGVVSAIILRTKQNRNFKEMVILGHIYHHTGSAREAIELNRATLWQHIQWEQGQVESLLRRLGGEKLVDSKKDGNDSIVFLTEKGKEHVERFWEENLKSRKERGNKLPFA